jgi:light-regulated signal transduction histidine kinase (bacteriophytochrome)
MRVLDSLPSLECEKEPICTPGRIQAHGALLIVEVDSHLICAVSNNIHFFLGITARELIGSTIENISCLKNPQVLQELLARPAGSTERFSFSAYVDIELERSLRYEVRVQSDASYHYVELHQGGYPNREFSPSSKTMHLSELSALLEEVKGNIFRSARSIVEYLEDLFQVARVLVYRFHPDWSGEVIAEVRRQQSSSFLGLRFPATDIPQQVRELYLKNPVREIANINAAEIALEGKNTHEFDLSLTSLRGVSPCHREYIRNMGLVASVSCALVVNQSLWGIIALQDDKPLYLSNFQRNTLLQIADLYSSRISKLHAQVYAQHEAVVATRISRLSKDYQQQGDLFNILLFGPHRLSTLLDVDGVTVVADTSIFSVGMRPSCGAIQALIDYAKEHKLTTFTSEHLSSYEFGDLRGCCGVHLNVLSFDPLLAIAVFRSELQRQVKWGGDPTRPFELHEETNTYRPRSSFEQWKIQVKGQCKPWEPLVESTLEALVSWITEKFERDVESIRAAFLDGIQKHRHLLENALDLRPVVTEFLFPEFAFLLWEVTPQGDGRVFPSLAFCTFFGLDEEEIFGNSVADVLKMIGVDYTVQQIAEKPRLLEVWSPTAGNCLLEADYHQVMTWDTSHDTTSIVVLYFHDRLPENRALLPNLDGSRHNSLSQRSSPENDLLGSLSHEIRTPLNVMTGFAQLLLMQREGSLMPKYQEYAREIVKAGKHVSALISDTLDFSKVQSGRFSLREEIFDLGQPLREAFAWLEEAGPETGVELTLLLPEEELLFCGDSKAIRQIALNLLGNAKKFTAPGGTVRLSLTRDSFGSAVIETEDTGIGIPLHLLSRIFEPFFQVDTMKDIERQGTGLGLTLVKAMVELHGGCVNVTSIEHQGSSFRLTFPAWRTR